MNNNLKLIFIGDVMIGRLMNDIIEENGPKWIWGNTLKELHDKDLLIINLETTLTTHTKKLQPKVFNYKSDPKNVQSLIEAGVDYASLANNHILDFMNEGLLETVDVLDKAGISHAGAGANIEQAKMPAIFKTKDKRIGIISFQDNEPGWLASDKPGTNYITINSKGQQEIEKQLKLLRSQVDILILSAHWGPNMRLKPSADFRTFAHSMIDNGVDIFHGHSAHIFQGIEVYKGKPILYDTGNYVDDYAVDPILRNDQGFIFKINYPESIELIPTKRDTFQVNKALGNETIQINKRMIELSKELNTILHQKNSTLFIELTS